MSENRMKQRPTWPFNPTWTEVADHIWLDPFTNLFHWEDEECTLSDKGCCSIRLAKVQLDRYCDEVLG